MHCQRYQGAVNVPQVVDLSQLLGCRVTVPPLIAGLPRCCAARNDGGGDEILAADFDVEVALERFVDLNNQA